MVKNISIRSKLEMLISLLLAIIAVFIYLYFPGKFVKQEIESLTVRARSIGEMTAFSVSSALLFRDEESALESLAALESNSDIYYAAVVDENGGIFVSSHPDAISAYVINQINQEYEPVSITDDILQMTTPVFNRGSIIGYVILGFSFDSIRRSAIDSRKIIALISVVIFILGIASAIIISTVITKPLGEMVLTVRKIEAGDLKQRATTGSGDEIDELAHSFNHMVQSLETSYEKLETFNRNLESRVVERTSQLYHEIETRRKAETDLLRAKNYAERLVKLTPIAIFSFDTNHLITSWNRKASEITGYNYNDAVGRKCHDILTYNNSFCDLFTKDKKSPSAVVSTITRKDGLQILISQYADSLRDEEGNIIGGIGCFEDITYRNRIEEELQIRQRMDSLGNLAGGIAHDFNNLLMGIMGNLDLIRTDPEGINDRHIENVEESFQLCLRAAKLVRDIQSLTGGTVIERNTVDLYDIASDVFNILIRTTDKLIEKRIDIEPGRYFVYANEDQLHQVLLNLGTNSVNALMSRGISSGDYIRIAAEDYIINDRDASGLPKGEYIHIMFEDNGEGMSESVRKRAFEPLFTTSQKSTKKGQGLGLAMVYNIITSNHEGYIAIDSTEKKGTTINIWLAKAIEPQKKVEASIDKQVNGKGVILFVDDEESIRKLVDRVLQSHGYHVITANDGIEGLEQFNRHKNDIDLVIIDLTMPRMSGDTLFKNIRAARADMRIIISSGQSEESLYKLNNLDGVLLKPYRVPVLLSTVRKALDSSVHIIDENEGNKFLN